MANWSNCGYSSVAYLQFTDAELNTMTTESLYSRVVKFLVSYCCFPILLLLFPFAKLYTVCTWSNWLQRPPCGAEAHRRKVERVQGQVRAWIAAGRPGKMCTARKPWKSFTIHSTAKQGWWQVDVDPLQDIVDVDTSARVLRVEPGMNMGRLTSSLLPMGWTIPVVPELDTLTIGGLVCGAGLETSSHLHGLFSDTCIAYEVVLPSGEVVRASKEENMDLFYAIPMSYGTVGFVTTVELPLVPAANYVRLEYVPLQGKGAQNRVIGMLGAPNVEHDFVEAIMYGLDCFVVMYGKMVNNEDIKDGPVNHINRWYKPWFYKYVESKLASIKGEGATTVEYVPLRDYYHRHTRAYFWEAAGPMPYGNQTWFRYLFGWIFPLNFQIVKLIIPSAVLDWFYVQNHVVQDFVLPMRHLRRALAFLDDLISVYPIWLCPCKAVQSPGMAGLGRAGVDRVGELFVDIGVYGDVPHTKVASYDPERCTRAMETFTIEHQGYQALYADSYLSRAEFAQMFDTRHYYAVRKVYGADVAFPDVYDKISRHARQ